MALSKTATEIEYTSVRDVRGLLKIVQFDSNFPFIPKRIFTISNILPGEKRGGHAHRQCHQIFMVVTGEVDLELTDGTTTQQIRIGSQSKMIWVKPGIWVTMSDFTENCVTLVFASEFYQEADYIYNPTELQEFNLQTEGNK